MHGSRLDAPLGGAQQGPGVLDARFGEILDLMPDGVVLVDLAGCIVYANGHACRLFGHKRDGLLGKPIEILLPQRYRGSHLGHRQSYFAQPRARAMGMGLELYGLRADGTEFPVEISLSPLVMEGGTYALSAIRDITERKKIEQALSEKNVELARASAAKDSFLAGMSHELRTPLNAIIGFTGTLLMQLPGPLNPEQEKQLKTVQTSARHLLSLINDLLDLAKIEAGKVELRLESISCQQVISDVAAALRPQAFAKGLRFELEMPTAPIMVKTDRRALSQILINLAGNAVKFTEHGSVFVRLARLPPAGVEISVVDTGPGIEPRDQAKLFGEFTQLDGRRDGSGLGLYLSRQLAQLLNGRLAMHSEPGKGATFSLLLPE